MLRWVMGYFDYIIKYRDIHIEYEKRTQEQREATHAIRKLGKEAGREIERIGNQTKSTHFFIKIKEEDWPKITEINRVLKTITYKFLDKEGETSYYKYIYPDSMRDILKHLDEAEGDEIKIFLWGGKSGKRDRKKENEQVREKTIELLKALLNSGYDGYDYCLSAAKTYVENHEGSDFHKDAVKYKILRALVWQWNGNDNNTHIDWDKIDFKLMLSPRCKNGNDWFIESDNFWLYKENDDDEDKIDDECYFEDVIFELLVRVAKPNERQRKTQEAYRKRKQEQSGQPKRPRGRPPKN